LGAEIRLWHPVHLGTDAPRGRKPPPVL